MDSLGCKEPWKDYLRREVGWAEAVLSRFTNDDDKVPHRHTDLFRERKIRVMTAPFPASDTLESAVKTAQEMSMQRWSYDVLKEMLAKVRKVQRSRMHRIHKYPLYRFSLPIVDVGREMSD